VSLPANTGGFYRPEAIFTSLNPHPPKKTLVLLPALPAKRDGQKATVFPAQRCCVLTADVFLLSYASCHTPLPCGNFVWHPRRGWLRQMNRFHHFPDCAGAVTNIQYLGMATSEDIVIQMRTPVFQTN